MPTYNFTVLKCSAKELCTQRVEASNERTHIIHGNYVRG